MPKVVYTAAKGLVQETGSGFEVADVGLTAAAAAGVTCNGFFAGFIPAVAAGNVAAVTSGAIPVTNYMTFVSTTGTVAYTLANGTAAGQLKKIMCVVAASTPNGVLTITTAASAAHNVVTFSALGDVVELMWNGSSWFVLAAYNVASGNIATPVVS